MSDMKCPYCDAGNKVCHDDGFGYQEDRAHEYECRYCGKMFVFYTTISFSYSPQKADCLNDGKHDLRFWSSYPRQFSRMSCRTCDYTRLASEAEIDQQSQENKKQ